MRSHSHKNPIDFGFIPNERINDMLFVLELIETLFITKIKTLAISSKVDKVDIPLQ